MAWRISRVSAKQKLFASSSPPPSGFGRALAVNPPYVFISAPLDSSEGEVAGAVYVFVDNGEELTEVQKLFADEPTPLEVFGREVALDGEWAAISTDNGGAEAEGSVHLFRLMNGQWTHFWEVVGPDTEDGDRFGWSLAIENGILMVGAYNNGPDGAVYAYTYDGADGWAFQGKLKPPDGTVNDQFGYDVDLNGSRVAIGAPSHPLHGAVYIFEPDGEYWIQTAKLVPAAPQWQNGDFGYDLCFDDADTLVIGAPEQRYQGVLGHGIAYAHRFDGSQWQETTTLLPADGAEDLLFGRTSAISNGRIVTGVPLDDEAGYHAGAAYLFDINDPDCDGNGISDDCPPDCNGNGAPDSCDIRDGISTDCNHNSIPDECDVQTGTSADCDLNGLPDECDFTSLALDSCPAGSTECESVYFFDDGTAESAVGHSTWREVVWLNQFTVRPGEETIVGLGVSWWEMPDGMPARLLVYRDPNDDGDPSDAELAGIYWTQTFATPSGAFVAQAILPTFVGEAGESFFVGVTMIQDEDQFPIAFDMSSEYHARSWAAASPASHLDLEDLTNNNLPIQLIDDCCEGNFLLRAVSAVALKCSCPGDIDADGIVGFEDLLLVLSAWGPCSTECPADVDGSGTVGFSDLVVILSTWGPCQ